MPRLREDLEALLKKYPDPRSGPYGRLTFGAKKTSEQSYPKLGVVIDNKDPDCLGRIKVQCDMLAPGAVTAWIPIVKSWSTADTGFWQLPDIGTQVLLVFPWRCINKPVVIGCLWDQKHKPPKHTGEKPVDSVVYQTKKSRLEILDESGKESITLMTGEGKMRLVMTKKNGIELINELGDIAIECKKLTLDAEKNIDLEAKKAITVAGEGEVSLKGKKGAKLINDKEVKLKGKNIKMEGSKGVATGGKQIAVEGDKVMGFDIHQMVIPSGSGTAVIPLPHPFIGKLNDKCSEDVKIGGKGAAVKGSKAKHDDAMHMQLPGTIKFNDGPKKEGEVTGGTASKVKINGKEAATIGSTVSTCNDMSMKENSLILAVGMSIPMPAIINPANMKEYKEEKEKKEKKPQFTTVKWGKSSAKEGEEIELSVQVKDIDDGNMVTFQVWKDGQDPASNIPQMQIPANVEGGAAKGKWQYRSFGNDVPPDSDPAFFFSAHSAWCPMKKSSNATVKMKRPELSSLEWKDEESGSSSKGLVGKPLKLSASCNSDMEDGAGVIFRVFPNGADVENDTPVAELASTNSGGKAEAEWTYHYKHDPENPLKEKPKYLFTANAVKAKTAKSGNVEIEQDLYIQLITMNGMIIKDADAILVNGDQSKDVSSKDGLFDDKGNIPGNWKLQIKEIKEDKNDPKKYEQVEENMHLSRIDYDTVRDKGVSCNAGDKQIVMIEINKGYST